ncbi:MAG: ADP-ribosylglycohydrolase family protein [Anaerolineaceae bacterium]|nr:ADP-ribosylglycohydrolase family protein [Anaerolineaceae bacterium]
MKSSRLSVGEKGNREEAYMLGAIIGDIVGSVFEWDNHRSTDFPLFTQKSTFTDDSVLTFATAKVILDDLDYAQTYQDFSRRYPGRGYGGNFGRWIYSDNPQPYNSFGNGSAMRISPVGFAYDNVETTLIEAKRSAEVTHNHPEGIKGAQAVALAMFRAREKWTFSDIKEEITTRFGYSLERTLDQIRPAYQFNETCQGSVPEAITALLESTSYEDAIRKAISIGGDSDTIACTTGGIAQAYYANLPNWIVNEAKQRLPEEFLEILDRFETRYLM